MSETCHPVRVRFAPSPTGYLHIGGARTALFNWLLARHFGGVMVLRIEDTDQSREVADSLGKILDDLRWLGLDWDEGPEVGGAHGPYFQSERLDLYRQYTQRLLESGDAYYALESPEELAAMRESARAAKQGFRYTRPDPLPTIEQGLAARAAGRPVTVRFKAPDREILVHDAVLGDVRVAAGELDDFVIQKRDGWPTYHLACVVDDALMRITHVLRGQEHLTNTPKHVALLEALGFDRPIYAHLSVIFNADGTKMSKRDKEKAIKKGLAPPEVDVHDFRAAGYLPEAVVNFISLLGWSTGDDVEQISLEETVRRFSLDRVGATNARFDRDKLIAFNTDWGERLSSERLVRHFRDYLEVNGLKLARLDDERLATLLAICRGFRTLADVARKCAFLVAADEEIEYDAKAVKKVLLKNDAAGFDLLAEVRSRLEGVSDGSTDSVQRVIEQMVEERAVKLAAVAQPLRLALTGTTVSPPIFETLSLLGRQQTLARIDRLLARKTELLGESAPSA